MTRLTCAFVFLALLFSAEIAFAQDLANQIVGVWQFGPSTRKYDGGDTTNRQISVVTLRFACIGGSVTRAAYSEGLRGVINRTYRTTSRSVAA